MWRGAPTRAMSVMLAANPIAGREAARRPRPTTGRRLGRRARTGAWLCDPPGVAGRGAGPLQVPSGSERVDGGGVALLVHGRVVLRAQQDHVGQVGRPAVAPVDAVVRIAPGRWPR